MPLTPYHYNACSPASKLLALLTASISHSPLFQVMMGVASGAIEKLLVSLTQSGDTLAWAGTVNVMNSLTPSSKPDPEVSQHHTCHTSPLAPPPFLTQIPSGPPALLTPPTHH